MKNTLMAAAAMVAVGVLAGCTATCPLAQSKKGLDQMKNQEFYDGGTFDPKTGINQGGTLNLEKVQAAYFKMFKKLGYPIYDVLANPAVADKDGVKRADLKPWYIDFKQGDFVRYGMGGIIWVNEIREEYFGHDIYLLPGQSIAEHRHMPTHLKTTDRWTGKTYEKDLPCKMESWLIRYGWVYGFTTEGEPNLDQFPEVKARLSSKLMQKDPKTGKTFLQCCHVEKWYPDGVAHKLAKDESWHFMMGGTDGAVVSEFANYHDGQGLRFSVPGAGF